MNASKRCRWICGHLDCDVTKYCKVSNEHIAFLKMEAIRFSETLIVTTKFRRHNPVGHKLHINFHENLRSLKNRKVNYDEFWYGGLTPNGVG